jgi:hypothetical protein
LEDLAVLEPLAIAILKAMSWLALGVGVLYTGSALMNPGSGPATFLVVVGSLFGALVTWAFLLVVASIAESLIAIRDSLAPDE